MKNQNCESNYKGLAPVTHYWLSPSIPAQYYWLSCLNPYPTLLIISLESLSHTTDYLAWIPVPHYWLSRLSHHSWKISPLQITKFLFEPGWVAAADGFNQPVYCRISIIVIHPTPPHTHWHAHTLALLSQVLDSDLFVSSMLYSLTAVVCVCYLDSSSMTCVTSPYLSMLIWFNVRWVNS